MLMLTGCQSSSPAVQDDASGGAGGSASADGGTSGGGSGGKTPGSGGHSAGLGGTTGEGGTTSEGGTTGEQTDGAAPDGADASRADMATSDVARPDAPGPKLDGPPARPDGAGSLDPGYGDLAALDKACTPTLTFKLEDTGPKGQIFVDAMGGSVAAAKETVLQISRDVCRVLYRQASEVRPANALELIIRDYDGVAGKYGDIGDIGIEISTQHLQNVKNQGRDVGAEIKGILFHEITHMYQNDDKPEGTWSGLPAYYEAGADAVRIRAGLAPEGCKPGKSGQWYQLAYCSGGWWWLWVDTKYPGFLYRLNLQMKGRDGKAWQPQDATALTGTPLDALWTEYKTAACCSPTSTACCK